MVSLSQEYAFEPILSIRIHNIFYLAEHPLPVTRTHKGVVTH